MSTLKAKLAFAQKHFTSPDGEPFSLEGREWVLEQMWRPLEGWKLWPVNVKKLCAACSKKANTLVEGYTASDETRTPEHEATGCDGLTSEPVIINALDLPRQRGKTMNSAAWCMAKAFKDDRESIALLAGSEDQIARIYNKNYKRPIENDPYLARRARTLGTRILVDERGSDIEVLPTAMSSVGDTRTIVVLDECRVVPPDVAVALLPTLFARGGWECPSKVRSHVRTHTGVDDPNAPKVCSVCQTALQPWYGRALLLSSAGELDDSDSDWFYEFTTYYAANPHKNVHVYADKEATNPKIARKVVDAVGDIFGALDSTKTFAGIEVGNEHLRRGQEFLTAREVERCVDRGLTNADTVTRHAVGFLDTSVNVEKTSLVIVEDDAPPAGQTFDEVKQSRLDFWIPRDMPGGVIDERLIELHAERVITLSPGLVEFWIDVRGMPWAVAMRDRLARKFKIVKGWTSNDAKDTDAGWQALALRMKAIPRPSIRLQACKEQNKEFAGLRLRFGVNDATPRVIDRDRRKEHADITASLAACCQRIAVLQLRGMGVSLAAVAAAGGAKVRVDRPRSGGRIFRGLGQNSY